MGYRRIRGNRSTWYDERGVLYVRLNSRVNAFREALRMPRLTVPYLAALLKRYAEGKNDALLSNCIVQDEAGNFLYSVNFLNAVLVDGSKLDRLRGIIASDNERRPWREVEREVGPVNGGRLSDVPAEPNMPDADMDQVSRQLIDFGNMNEGKKNIIITEAQLSTLKEAYFVESEKVRVLRNFLDSHFIKGSHPMVGEDGEPKVMGIVGMIIPGADPKPMTATQLFYYMQNHFKNLYADKKQRDALIKLVIKKWYYDEIDRDNTIRGHNNYSE